ncbi:hypothetical protein MTR67_036709 [Solanum verrucosum]|uniref:Uncharacterized protein n=1 Tax=Solanum verrucosum TaxID=315347 RepID=A0AAF0ZNJ9_SOLVR|nr:hypothetical protein MTR67_036709 [Solanum verrucosum]
MEKPTVYTPQHVGTSTAGEILNWESRDQARDRNWKGKWQLHAIADQISERKNQGPKKALGPTRFKQKESSQEAQRLDLVSVEIMANLSQTKMHNRLKNLDNLEVDKRNFMPRKQEETIQEEGENAVTVAKATNMGKQIMDVSQLNGKNDSNTEITDDVVPLMIQLPLEDKFNSKSHPLWIKQHILKLSTEFGVDFRGCEEKTEEIFMKIDNNKQGNKGGKGEVTTNKKKGANKLKSLELDTKFMSFGTSSRGRYLAIEQ